ncbi:DNA mismatch repair protein Vsr [Paenibacillus sp. IHB B 3415]|uniref:very short patch repair endonuclease n=1 Tax=Paenibacillus sp. IHB B 3415 TaxID=867080 RepID=UPI000574A8D2|nr:very short patch repair endonuclease [Paenibacillus sp. IHB B 3415]KHL95876.1 DNA mismatch repair protein Vsr [Paenibacillus sp. IHB B 3415]
MTDIVSKETRSRMMKNIKSISKLEDRIAHSLWRKGYRFRRNSKNLFGKPDLSIKKYKIVIFIDSCFWHMCEEHLVLPKTNAEFWLSKLEGNRLRDIRVDEYYENEKWYSMRIWEHEFKKDFNTAVERIARFIDNVKDVEN